MMMIEVDQKEAALRKSYCLEMSQLHPAWMTSRACIFCPRVTGHCVVMDIVYENRSQAMNLSNRELSARILSFLAGSSSCPVASMRSGQIRFYPSTLN